jgi:hypothetical protein
VIQSQFNHGVILLSPDAPKPTRALAAIAIPIYASDQARYISSPVFFFCIIRVCVRITKVVGPGTFSGHKRAEENSGPTAQFVQIRSCHAGC